MDEYTRIAPWYNFVTTSFLRGPRQAIAQSCSRLGARSVLDVGCGTGLLLHMLHSYLGDHVRLLAGIDYSQAMLKQAAPRKADIASCERNRLPCVISVRADARALPFQDEIFDVAIFSLILHETCADPKVLLQKVLEIAPRLIILDWRMPDRNLDFLACAWVPLVERLAGSGHFKRYRKFMREGGLWGLAHRLNLRVMHTERLKGGSLELMVVERTV